MHLDLDVLDPEDFPAQFPAPGGLPPDKLYDLLEAVAGDCELVGLEVTRSRRPRTSDAPPRWRAAMRVLEPLLDELVRH